MNRSFKTLCNMLIAALCITRTFAQTGPHYLIANDNNPDANFVTVFKITADGNLSSHRQVLTGGLGANPGGGGAGSVPAVAAFRGASQDCIFVAEGGSSDIAALDTNLRVVGNFHGGPLDFGTAGGISLAVNRGFLYAAFSGDADHQATKSRLASYQIRSGCQLEYLGSVPAAGLGSHGFDFPPAIAANGKILVVAYGDGSIESFHFSNGMAKSNGDLQDSTGSGSFFSPISVDISKDGKFAIFGDFPDSAAFPEVVEVANISSGKLSRPTIVYNLGSNLPSGYVRLSPDESLLYIAGDAQEVAAALFNKTTGVVTAGCFTPLKDPQTEWWITGSIAFADNTSGNGATLYISENSTGDAGTDQYVATVDVNSNGRACSLAESPKSNFELQSNSFDFGTVVSWPPRAF